MQYLLYILFTVCFASQYLAQQQVVLDNHVFITISNNANVVLDNPNDNALLVNSSGKLISEGENNVLKWMIKNNTGNYIIPFATSSFSFIPLQLNITTAGVGSNASVLFSTYETATDKNNSYPSDVTNLNSNCRDSVGLFTVDRFWRIDAQNFTTKPTPVINFGYENSSSELGGLNTITEAHLKAMRFNNTTNSWETPQKLFGIPNTSSKTVSSISVSPTDFYKSWALVDSSIMSIPVTITAISNNTFCAGGTTTITPIGAASYTLLPNLTTSSSVFTVMPLASSVYTIIGSIGSGSTACMSNSNNSPTVSITVNSLPIINSSVTSVKCFGEHTGSAIVLVSSSATYTWSNGSHASILSGISAGNYSVSVTDDNGCANSQTIEITQPNSPLSIQLYNQNSLCYGQTNGFANAVANGGTPNYTYTWQPLAISNASVSNLSIGNYTVYATDANGCKTHSIVSISEPSFPLQVVLSDSTIAHCGEADGSLWAEAFGGTGNYQYQWFPVSSNQSSVHNLVTGSYTVVVTDANDCKDSLHTTLSCESPIVIPQVFTPNADGKNDLFVIIGLERYPNNEINVFNRWGSLIYTQQHYQNNWNGYANTVNSKERLPAATYFVVVEFGEPNMTPYSGFVELRY